MPEGCRLCVKGAKLVLFVTGRCRRECYYCPLSEKRKGKDVVYANERPVSSIKDIFTEAEEMSSLGAGITGGDPSMRLDRVLRYIKALKKRFGKEYHVHMYSCEELTLRQLEKLKCAGLDEIRFHSWSAHPVGVAIAAGLYAGAELPVIPGEYPRLKKLLKELDSVGCKFVNLNELEFSETNAKALLSRGFELKSEDSPGVKGSEKTAVKILRWAAASTKLSIHYCPSKLKDSVQLRNRLKRKARNVARPHETITADGLLFKGVILDLPPRVLLKTRNMLLRKYGLPPELIAVSHLKKRIEMEWRLAKKIAEGEPSMRVAWVEEYPTSDRLETTLIPLSKDWSRYTFYPKKHRVNRESADSGAWNFTNSYRAEPQA